VRVEEGASIGSDSFVLYDSRVGAGASLGDLSLIMKHETFLPGRRYRGLPAENVHELTQAEPAAVPPVAGLTGAAERRVSAALHVQFGVIVEDVQNPTLTHLTDR
jgi:carbonic anhydrase/acetyltransferase-like protein (isoleucine patch superfamily)